MEPHKLNSIKQGFVIGICAGLIVGICIVATLELITGATVFTRMNPGYHGFSQIKPFDWMASKEGYFHLVLANEAETNLSIFSGSVDVQVDDVNCSSVPLYDMNLSPGQKVYMNSTCRGLEDYDVGSHYEANIHIAYSDLESEATYYSVGKCWGPIE